MSADINLRIDLEAYDARPNVQWCMEFYGRPDHKILQFLLEAEVLE
jgi:hypothetical protein